MAIAIKSIPVLSGKLATSFVKSATDNFSKKSTVDFSKQINKANQILAKSKLK
jgi:hypothetical protein